MYYDNNGMWNLFSATGNPLFYLAYKELLQEEKDKEKALIARQKQ